MLTLHFFIQPWVKRNVWTQLSNMSQIIESMRLSSVSFGLLLDSKLKEALEKSLKIFMLGCSKKVAPSYIKNLKLSF